MIRRQNPMVIVVVLLSILLATSSAFADGKEQLDLRIDLDLECAEPYAVFQAMAGVLQVDLFVAESIDKELTIRLRGVSARTSLDAICESIGCEWRLENDPARRLVVEPATGAATGADPPGVDHKIDVSLRDAQAASVFAAFAGMLGAGLELDPGLEGKTVTIEVKAVEVGKLLDQICRLLLCQWSLTEEPEGKLVIEPWLQTADDPKRQ